MLLEGQVGIPPVSCCRCPTGRPTPCLAPDLPGSGQVYANLVFAQCGLAGRYVDSIQAGGILAQNLALNLWRKLHFVLLFYVVRQIKSHEFLDQPFGVPDGIVAAEKNLVLAQPE